MATQAHIQNIGPSLKIRRAIDEVEWEAEKGWDYFSELCESPIERLLMEEIFADWIAGRTTGLVPLGRKYEHGEARFLSSHGIIVYPQAWVDRCRADFLLDVLMPDGDRQIFVVECDGHDFHDRTREQAESDRKRDRVMSAHGIRVLRFTGREINRDPESVWREIIDIVTDKRGPQWSHPIR